MLVAVVNCQKEDLNKIQEQEVTTKSLFKQRTVSLAEIPKIEQKVIEKLNPEIFNRTEGSNTNEAIFDTDNIVEIADTLNNVNYSFQFRFPDTPISTFYNLVVGEAPNGDVLTPFVMKYTCDSAYLDQYVANGLDFQYFVGTMAIHKYTDFFALGEFDRTETQCPPQLNDVGDPISCSQDPVDGGNDSCCSDRSDGPGDGNTGGGGNDTVICTNQVYVTGCNGDSTNVLHPIGECWNPNQSSVVRHNVWVCDGEAVLGPNNTDTGRTVNNDCPSCTSPTGGVGTNPVSLADMQDYLKDNLDLSFNGISFIGSSTTLSVTSVNSLYNYSLAHISPATNELTPEAKAYEEDIVETGGDGNLVSALPYIKYPEALAAQYKADYPKLTEYLINQLPKVADIPLIVNTIKYLTDLPEDQIKRDLMWESGPTIYITQLDNFSENTSDKTVGRFEESEPDVIYLDIDYVNSLENSTATQYEQDAFLFFLGTTILHEYVHYGDFQDGVQYPGEEGILFELYVYGENVSSENAALILNRQ